MRIIYLHQYFNTPAMAGGTRSYEMARRLVAAGHDVQMVTTWREPTTERTWFVTTEAGITVHWLPLLYSNHMSFAQRIRAFARFAIASARKAAALPGDVVFATSTPLTIAIPGMFASLWKRIPMVFEVRDLWPDVPIAMGILKNPVAIRAAKLLERLTYRRSARVVAVAPGMKESITRRGMPSERISVIPNGCDFDLFDDKTAKAIEYPNRQPGAKILLYLGAMGIANGVEYIPRLAQAIHRCSDSVAVQFYLIGDGSQRYAAEALAEQLDVLGTMVQFVGTLPKREVAHWIASADATIITYDGPEVVYRDSVSNKFFDSIAAGKPVIANYSGFATLVAVEAGAGFIISRDIATAAREILAILSGAEDLANAGARAIYLARTRFSRDVLAADLEQVLVDAVRMPVS